MISHIRIFMKLLGNIMDIAKLSGLKIVWTPIVGHSYGDMFLVPVLISVEGDSAEIGPSTMLLLVSL